MNFDEWHDHAAELAYAAHGDSLAFPWTHLPEAEREKWRGIARAVLAEGKIEVRPSAELAEAATREENERLIKIARERAEDAQSYRDAADELRSKLAGLRRAYEHACAQRDKYMRRTAEWRDVAQNDTFRQDTAWLVSEIGREHIDRCEVEQCDTCSVVLGIEEKLHILEDDGVRACTGCGQCDYCQRKAADDAEG